MVARHVRKTRPSYKKTFEQILVEGERAGMIPAKSQEARDWFRKKARSTVVNPSLLIREEKERLKVMISQGKMYAYFYDPKLKNTLPYYDQFPLIFVIEKYSDGSWLGLNLHYLPFPMRAKLMDALYTLSVNKKYDEKTKLNISYGILKEAAKFKAFKPCIKRYLRSQIRSKFMEVYSNEWDIALFLPLAQFAKATQQQVWRDSVKNV